MKSPEGGVSLAIGCYYGENMINFDIKEITPYVTFFGPIAGFIAIWDYLLRDSHKSKVWDGIVSIAQLGKRPLSFAFYGLITVTSVAMTIAILSISGIASKSESGSIIIGLKSSGPILLAVILKIVLFDYILALKSFSLVEFLISSGKDSNGKYGKSTITLGCLIVVCDLFLTGFLTGFFMNFSEAFQTRHINNNTASIPAVVQPAIDFFDSISLMVKESIRKSFYALNGTLIMYVSLLISAITEGVVKYLNIEDIKKNIFKILAAVLVFAVLVVAVARHFSD